MASDDSRKNLQEFMSDLAGFSVEENVREKRLEERIFTMFKATITSLVLMAILAAGVLAMVPGSSSAADFGNQPFKPCPAGVNDC